MSDTEHYLIRKRILKLFGAAFHIYAPDGTCVGYCKQKAFKLKEDLRIYRDERCDQEVMLIKAQNIIDFGATYRVMLPDGTPLGSFRRRGLKSTFLQDHWMVLDEEEREVGEVVEQGGGMAMLRRLIGPIGFLFPEVFVLSRLEGEEPIASFRTTRNLITRSLGITIHQDDRQLDELLILAAGCLLCAFERRDQS